jgi:integrase
MYLIEGPHVIRKIGYLYQRDGSSNWYVRLQTPGKTVAQSLHTSDRREAEINALPFITQHKAALLAQRMAQQTRVETRWRHDFEPGRSHSAPDGGQIIATDKELIYLDSSGSMTKTVPNGGPTQMLIAPRMGFVHGVPAKPFGFANLAPRPTVMTKDSDDAIIEAYLRERNVVGYPEREARAVWAQFKSMTKGKKLVDCTRKEGRALAEHYAAQGIKTASVKKKIGWLVSAVNFAIDEGDYDLTLNPFVGVVRDREDSIDRLPFDDDDVRAIRRNMDKLSAQDRLLLTLLASTGMRRGEAFEISGEMTERGVRYVIVGTKTDQSRRRVPLPAAVLRLLPKKINSPLFTGRLDAATKRLGKFVRACGIADPAKAPMHSFRHRAKDRLRAAECPLAIQYELLGHEEKTVAAGYGKGSPVPTLKRWIDKIGF